MPFLVSEPVEADIALQPGGDITDNNIWINITVNGDDAIVEIVNEYYLIDMASMIHNYSNDVFSDTASRIAGAFEEPEFGEIDTTDHFKFIFDTNGTFGSEVFVRYNLTMHFNQISGINYTRMLTSLNHYDHPESFYSSIQDFNIFIHSNTLLDVNNGTLNKTGHDVQYSYEYVDENYYKDYVWFNPDYGYPSHEINWGTEFPIAPINEIMYCKLNARQVLDIANLVKHEEIFVSIMNPSYIDANETKWINGEGIEKYFEFLQPVCEYNMDASLVLDGDIIQSNSPCVLWFPNKVNEATASMEWEYTERGTGNTKTRVVELTTKSIIKMWGGENGFSIEVPDFFPYDQLVSDPVLNVNIFDSQFKYPYTYFDIVTIPSDSESFLEFKIYDGATLGHYYSKFLNDEIISENGCTIVRFSGQCLDYGLTFLYWHDQVFDTDCDGRPNHEDAFPDDPLEWEDWDHDRIGNNADTDWDNDGISNYLDDHEFDAFPDDRDEHLDNDGDGVGDNADTDDDNDGISDDVDANPWLLHDRDGDGIGDRYDAYPDNSSEWVDTDGDGIGNNADTDADNDGILDTDDAFPFDPTDYEDYDNDGYGNNYDYDDDNDGVDDIRDDFPLNGHEWLDTDGDGIGDNAENYGITDSVSTEQGHFISLEVIGLILGIFVIAICLLIMIKHNRKHS